MTIPESKTCTKCSKNKPLSDYYFEKGKPRACCKACHKAKVAALRDADREVHRAKQRAWTKKNRTVISAREKHRRETDGETINARRRERRADDPERFREINRRWWTTNRDQIGEQRRAWYAENKDRIRALVRADRKANPQKYRQQELANPNRASRLAWKRVYNRAYYEANRDLFAAHRRKREARIAEVEYQSYTRTEIFERDGGQCRGCCKALKNEPYGFQIDHIVPISLGGPDTPANVQLMCGPCNREKWAKLDGQIHLPV